MHYLRRAAAVVLTALLLTTTVVAQWLNYPTPGVPRLPDGKPDLSAPAPRTADGKPDLSGIWSGRTSSGGNNSASNPYRPKFLGSSCYRGQNTTAPDYILRP